ncbi:single-strand DNA endonuclease ASTE1 [Pagrus major]|uniref:single-strand DNA endonuclease ASTE1 n=1 Tax=Pagrus major TaxID=143350 RepID=UPI003CC86661
MGVQGLTTFLESHQQIYRDVRFRMSRLVIDGCNLLHLLYFDSGLDQNHGGEYAAFEALVERFVAALRACEIQPYVVLDGGTDPSDKKLETVTQRAEDRILRAHRAASDGSRENIVPSLVKVVFRQTLARLEVPSAKCYGEADQEIAALANAWDCPVLSSDSDFYIFALSAGLLPLAHFRWAAAERSCVPCRNYKTSNICVRFGIEPPLLPAFAALAGNDYVKLQRTEYIRWSQFCPAGSGKPSRLEGLLCWLRSFREPQEAFEAALELIGPLSEKRKAEVLQGLYLGMEEYRLPACSLQRFFLHGTAPPLPAEDEAAGLVPDWIRLPFTQDRLPSDILDVLRLQRMNLGCPVARADRPSAYLTSRPVRQVMYGLLLGRGRPVLERDRDGLQLTFIPVQPASRGVARQLLLSSLDKAEPAQRLQVLLEALGVTEASLSRLPPPLRLLVAVTCYWMQRAQPPPGDALLKALLLGATNGDALRGRADLQIQNQHKPDVGVAHAFSQWQACMKDSIHLNQLLGFPLPEPQIARFYEGTLVHNLVHLMRTRKMKRLKYNPSSVKQYRAMLSVVHQSLSREATKPPVTQTTPPSPRRQQVDDLTASLHQLFLRYEDDEEAVTEAYSVVRALQDQNLDDLLSVRTRYRARERVHSGKNPDLVLKKERRGGDIL